jgi:hypothetical protein
MRHGPVDLARASRASIRSCNLRSAWLSDNARDAAGGGRAAATLLVRRLAIGAAMGLGGTAQVDIGERRG